MWQNIRKKIWEWRGAWITAPSVAAIVIGLRMLGVLQYWELMLLDQYYRWRPAETRDDRIIIIGIDEPDLKKLKQWPINDEILAELLEKIKAQNPRVIGLDLYRDFPVEPGYEKLVKILENTPNLIGIENVGLEIDPPPVLAEKGQVGVNDLVVDPDGKLRRGLLSRKKNDQLVASFNMILAGIYLQKEGIAPQPDETNPKIFRWGKAIFKPFESTDGSYVNADDGGYQVLLNYRGPGGSFTTISMTEVLEEKIPPDLFSDRIVLIGATATSLNDFFYTPYSGNSITTPERTAGVEIQANIISQTLSAAIDGRTLLKTWPEPVEWLWILVWSGVSSTLLWGLRYAGGAQFFSIQKTAVFLLTLGIFKGSCYIAFLNGWWIPVLPPLLALGGSGIAITGYTAKSAGEIRKTFGRYLTDQVVANLLENPEGLQMGGNRKKITILTSDLRGFTAISERLSPEEVVKVLNFYLCYMADIITKYGGTIDEFMGDGILVLFGAPTSKTDDAERAIACGIAMQLAMIPINKQVKEWGLTPLEMGIGINTGEVVVGNIGSEKRTKYGVVGAQVNLTYRIESNTIGGQVVISESTLKEAGKIVQIDSQKQVQMKGVKEPITICYVGGIGGKYNLFLPKEEEIFVTLKEPLLLRYKTLSGKQIGDEMLSGSLVQLSDKGAEVIREFKEGEELPTELTNIVLNLLEEGGKYSEDIYAKVLKSEGEKNSFYIRFTAKPPEVAAKLESLYKSLQV